MTPEELAALIRTTLVQAARDGQLALEAGDIPPAVAVERPRTRDHGDWSTNVAMQLAKKAHAAPRDVAAVIADRLLADDGIDEADVAGPGFINIRLAAASAGELARTILQAGPAFGANDALAGTHVNLEYVSANPTGPVHLGGARWAAVGDSLARLIAACGAEVTREYYFNDHGSQIDRFARSLYARAMGREAPEDGYGGQYVADIAAQVRGDALAAGEPDPVTLPEADAVEAFRARGVDLMFDEIKQRLHDFRSDFDVFFHEQSLHDSGAVTRAIQVLRDRGEVFDADGAVWLRTTDYGDDKDRVLIKSDGQAAYFAADVAYYLDKRQRGADAAIYLLGADHHGYIGRMMAMCEAFGDTPGVNMQILIGQMVNLVRNGEPVRMSKRAGTIVTLDDLVDAVGVDAARYSLVRVSMDSNLDIDLDLLTSRTNDNPVYYVQYAHARSRNVARNAAEHGVAREAGFDPSALDSPADADLLGVLAQFPAMVAQAAKLREPHRVARYLEQLASAYHTWYGQCRVTPRGEEPVTPGHIARLWLNDAVSQVLRNGLGLLGVQAPERM
ncbi:MAG: arginine--tRNA ligase [Actinomyces sp.]|nr:arginine--tRNA ligase [Actinomyces sp.]MCI1640939.1 arginine--tRNA ligase [Actinomyces sp.]MCI1661307.1 arginine--tRNA ligase [Actinomyces sp.]MCI1690315.1 arginine--tRNA ligase [Actinomyces sp.]MCI1786956.1 arginine--tRNA ligase [Actinomyces sp.]MCI1829478.1 arginine--tRNA ligase [Actinomyces sp.]